MNDKREALAKPQIITLVSDSINILSHRKKYDSVAYRFLLLPPLIFPAPAPSQFVEH